MIWRPSHHRRLAQAADALTTAGSFVVAYFLWDRFRRFAGIALPIRVNKDVILVVTGFSFLWVIIFDRLGAYSYLRFTSLGKELAKVVKTTLIGVSIFFAAHFFFRFGYIARTYILIFTFTNLLLLTLEKTGLYFVAKEIRKSGIGRKRVLVVGAGEKMREFVDVVKKNIDWGLDIVGVITEKDEIQAPDNNGLQNLGTFNEIESVLHNQIIEEVIICVPIEQFGQIRKVLECCEREGVQVRLFSDFFSKILKRVRVDQPYGMNIVSFMAAPDNEIKLYVKRILDVVLSGLMFVILSPFLLIIAILVKVSSKGPIFYEWNVIGLNKKPFRSWKFRTMVPNADAMKTDLSERNEMNGPVFKIKNDPRVTKVGKFLRKFSLDELPQLWSILKGDMSFVGPRPAGPHELARYDSWHRRKLSVKPGLTCLWQVKGRNKINDFNEWVRLDLEYIENWSLWLDFKILLKTILVVIRGTGS
jgi:exopolysaccharide biosynthesis polyprenyl glycosylphosphotransferase